MIQVATYDHTTGQPISEYTDHITRASIINNEHGFASAKIDVDLSLTDAMFQYERSGLQNLRLTEHGAVMWDGRIEDPMITSESLEIVAMGYQRSFFDTRYTAFWSSTDFEDWETLNDTITGVVGTASQKYYVETKGRLYLSLQKNTTYLSSTDYYIWAFRRPDKSNRYTIGVSYDYEIGLPSGFQLVLQTRADDMTFISNVLAITATGGSLSGTINIVLSGSVGVVCFVIYNNSGASYTNTFDNGVWGLDIKNLRVVSSTTNRVNTTLGTAVTAPGVVTITPASMNNIYAGQYLQIDSGTTSGETVIVITTGLGFFTALFAKTHTTTGTITSHVVYADEVVEDMITSIQSVNGAVLSSNTSFIQSPMRDIQNLIVEDQRPSDVMNNLCNIGDNQSVPQRWDWQVWNNRIVEFKPKGYDTRTWNVIIADISISRRLDDIINSYYAVYKDANGRTIRGTTATDTTSVAKYGITRVDNVKVNTSIDATANAQRDTLLNYNKDPKPSILIEFIEILDQGGASVPLTDPRPGDILYLQNLPADLASSLDFIRSMTISQTTYDPVHDELKLESDIPFPSIELLLSRSMEIATRPVPFLGYA